VAAIPCSTEKTVRSDKIFSMNHANLSPAYEGLADGRTKAALPARVLQIDALEDGGHLGGRDLDAIPPGRRETEDATLQALRPHHAAIAVPREDYDAIATTIEKNEEMIGEWILSDDRRGQGRKPVKPATHVPGRTSKTIGVVVRNRHAAATSPAGIIGPLPGNSKESK
jgi:hypothetical protein